MEMDQDGEGRMYSEVTGLYLGVQNAWFRWITLEGEVVVSSSEWAEQAHQQTEQAGRLAQDEYQRAEQAEAMREA
jgi:hypothetical protein